MMIQGSKSQTFKISQHAYQFYQEFIAPHEQEMFNIFEVDPLSDYDLRAMLIDLAHDYQNEMSHEITM